MRWINCLSSVLLIAGTCGAAVAGDMPHAAVQEFSWSSSGALTGMTQSPVATQTQSRAVHHSHAHSTASTLHPNSIHDLLGGQYYSSGGNLYHDASGRTYVNTGGSLSPLGGHMSTGINGSTSVVDTSGHRYSCAPGGHILHDMSGGTYVRTGMSIHRLGGTTMMTGRRHHF